MRPLSIYLDTSVISYLFAEDEPEKRAITIEFFDNYLAKYIVSISEVVLFEIDKATSSMVRDRLMEAVDNYALSIIQVSPTQGAEVSSLAEACVQSRAVPRAKREDALHLAIATVLEYDILLSWNFRHLANIRTQMRVNAVNVQAGYLHPLNLLNPMEVMYHGE